MRHVRRDRDADRRDVPVERVPPAGRVAAPPREHRRGRHPAQQPDRRLAVAREDPVLAARARTPSRPASPRGSRRSRRCRSGPGGGRRPSARRTSGAARASGRARAGRRSESPSTSPSGTLSPSPITRRRSRSAGSTWPSGRESTRRGRGETGEDGQSGERGRHADELEPDPTAERRAGGEDDQRGHDRGRGAHSERSRRTARSPRPAPTSEATRGSIDQHASSAEKSRHGRDARRPGIHAFRARAASRTACPAPRKTTPVASAALQRAARPRQSQSSASRASASTQQLGVVRLQGAAGRECRRSGRARANAVARRALRGRAPVSPHLLERNLQGHVLAPLDHRHAEPEVARAQRLAAQLPEPVREPVELGAPRRRERHAARPR